MTQSLKPHLTFLVTLTLAACNPATDRPINPNSTAGFGIHAVLQGEDGRAATTLPDGMVLGTDVELHADDNGETLFVVQPAAIGKACLKDIRAEQTDYAGPVLSFTLSVRCAQAFGTFTAQNVNQKMAIMLNGELVTAPIIRAPITGGAGYIEGGFESLAEAEAIARQFY